MKNNEETSYKPSLEKESIRGTEGNMSREHERSQRGQTSEGSMGQGPDEAKENMKNKVAKGVATVAGALEGFAKEARETDLPQKTKEAIDKAGETAKQATEATKKQVDRMKGGSGSKDGSSSNRGTGSAAGSTETSYQRATGASAGGYGGTSSDKVDQ